MHAHADILAEHRQIFSQIELLAQFIDCGMPLPDLFHRGRRKQPRRECVFPHARACGRQKLEQAALAEQVKIGGVDMMWIVKALARLTRPGPTIFNPGQRFFIKRGCALGQFARPQDPRVIPRDDPESRHRRGEPPGRESMRPKRGPRHDHRQDRQNKPDVPQANMNFLVVGNARLACVSTLHVFFGGKHWLKM